VAGLLGFVNWRPHLGPLSSGLITLAVIAWLCLLYYRNRTLHSTARSWLLVLPKILAAVLVLIALFDPSWRATRPRNDKEKVLALLDVSSSMDVRDKPEGPRVQRARAVLKRFQEELSGWLDFDVLAFDREVHELGAEKKDGVRETDLGKCLVTVAERPDLSAYLGVVLLTDGGDEPVQCARMPGAPLYIVGMGSDPSTWNDLSIADVDAPTATEENAPFDVAADVVARSADGDFSAAIRAVTVSLQEAEGGDVGQDGILPHWKNLESKTVDLSKRRERLVFRAPGSKELGVRKFKVAVSPVSGELSTLNNERTFTVEVRKRSIYVLFFSRTLDWDFALLKRELKNDPAINVTAVYRKAETLVSIEGDRQKGDEALNQGFPADENLLDLYKCIILGSFPAQELQPAQCEALRKYVEKGGAVVFLGGPDSFGRGGYESRANGILAPLFPWQISGSEPEITAGRFPVTVPPQATEHAAIAAAAKALSQVQSPEVYSVNNVGNLRTGALSLLDVSAGGKVLALVALQPFGRGQTLGVATNTLWRWGQKEGETRKVYALFWQQAVRYMSGLYEGDRFIVVKWDRKQYRPGEAAEATLHIVGQYATGQVRLSGSVAHAGLTQKVSVDPVLGTENTHRARMFFPERGEYLFHVEALAGSEKLDSYERNLRVQPTLNEGACLEVDEAFLDDLASRSGGQYANESEAATMKLIEILRAKVLAGSVVMDIPLVNEKYAYFSLLLLILVAEWVVRRRMNIF